MASTHAKDETTGRTEKTQATEAIQNAWAGYAQGWAENAKEALGLQVKTSQLVFDHAMKMSQTVADFYQSQASEGLKLSQATYSSAKSFGETLVGQCRRQFTEMTETALKTER